MAQNSKVLITGKNGFTGAHLSSYLEGFGYTCIGLNGNICDPDSVKEQISEIAPNYVVHLAAVSNVADYDYEKIYQVNMVGTTNLLEALKRLKRRPQKIVIASSATIYGNQTSNTLHEDLAPDPVNYYGISKLAMEHIARTFYEELDIIITRPFNYTGVGHSVKFLIPKIITAYQKGAKYLELGNISVSREFNDVRDVVEVYRRLLLCDYKAGPVNICSGKSISIEKILMLISEYTGKSIEIRFNSKYARSNDIIDLSGDNDKLRKLTSYRFEYNIESTLLHMLSAK